MPAAWKDYLTVPGGAEAYGECSRRCRGAYERQSEIMRSVIEATKPRTVACLGAGVLNDIPYSNLVRRGATIHLVDWLPGVIDAGIGRSIIERGEDGAPQCIYCELSDDCARTYCRNFTEPLSPGASVCDHFAPGPGHPPVCTAFEKGDRPLCHRADVTGGYASAFAERVLDEVSGARSWKMAFRRADALAKQVKRHRTSLAIADSSVDLVTSSMLISQFEHEPYDYFSQRAADALGPPKPQEERRLWQAVKTLRATLFTNQLEKHCEEIERILAPGGRCFMSFEMFHFDADESGWFLVENMHRALGLLARRFRFNFEILSGLDLATRFEGRESASIVYAFMLEPKAP